MIPHITRLGRIALAVLVSFCFLLGQWVEVWHHHSNTAGQSKVLSLSQTAKIGELTSHDSCPICNTSQFIKDGLMKPVSEFFASVSKSVVSFFKFVGYKFLAAILYSGRAPPTL
ncbi:MAG: hypothetical protein HYZ54_11680 [Ignavibacteriae bacterium]|nr:hypothetical protein [Ignavibacteriota bacterium]